MVVIPGIDPGGALHHQTCRPCSVPRALHIMKGLPDFHAPALDLPLIERVPPGIEHAEQNRLRLVVSDGVDALDRVLGGFHSQSGKGLFFSLEPPLMIAFSAPCARGRASQ